MIEPDRLAAETLGTDASQQPQRWRLVRPLVRRTRRRSPLPSSQSESVAEAPEGIRRAGRSFRPFQQHAAPSNTGDGRGYGAEFGGLSAAVFDIGCGRHFGDPANCFNCHSGVTPDARKRIPSEARPTGLSGPHQGRCVCRLICMLEKFVPRKPA